MSVDAQPLLCYLVEWYRAGLDAEQLNGIAAAVDRSLASVRAEGSLVQRVWTLAVPTDDMVFGVFMASSADIVELVCRRAGMPASRLTAALADCDRAPHA